MLPVRDPLLVFTVLLLVALAAPLLAGKLRLPDLVLLMLAGTALGPHGFGVLELTPAIDLFKAVGLVYIMFLSGLEIDLYQFVRTRRRSVAFGLLTFAIPQGLGTLAVRFTLGFSWSASVLLASMFASHTLLTYPIASRLGIHRTEPVTITVGATIVTDTLALLVLAVIADSARGMDLGVSFWIGLAVGMALLVALIWWGIPRMARWFFQRVTESGGAQFLFVLATVCACSFLAKYARMEPIIGAFLAGAAFNRLVPEHSPLMNRIRFTGNNLFIPVFLMSVGMLVDPRSLLASPRTWLVIAVMVGGVIATKFLAAWTGRKLFGYDRDEGLVMFGLSVVQAAATLAAVVVGLDLKILDATALNGAIAMILTTCMLGAWVVERHGRRMAMRTMARPALAAAEQRLLLPVANPASAARLMDLAFLLRDPAVPGVIHPLTIVREETDLDDAVARGEALLARCMTQASATEEKVVPGVRVDINPADGIVRAVRELRASAVLAGWGDETSASARIFGSVNRQLTLQCPSRLYLCRLMRPLNTTRVIRLPLPPLAGFRTDLAAVLREARLLARQAGAELHVYFEERAANTVKDAVERATPAGPTTFIPLAAWTGIAARLAADLHPDDLVLLPLERRSAVLWTPAFDRLPERLAADFPETNLLVAYPALPADPAEAPIPREPGRARAPELKPVEFPAGLGMEAALRRLVGEGLADDPVAAAAAGPLLAASYRGNPVEPVPGVVLVHAHVGGRPATRVLVGRGELPPGRDGLAAPIRVVLALLSPRDDPPEVHLRSLAALARRFRDPATAAAIAQAGSAAEVCRLLGTEPPAAPGAG